MKKLIALVMIVSVMSALFAGCNKGDDSGGSKPADAPKDAGK